MAFELLFEQGKRTRPRSGLDANAPKHGSNVQPRQQPAIASEKPAEENPSNPCEMEQQDQLCENCEDFHLRLLPTFRLLRIGLVSASSHRVQRTRVFAGFCVANPLGWFVAYGDLCHRGPETGLEITLGTSRRPVNLTRNRRCVLVAQPKWVLQPQSAGRRRYVQMDCCRAATMPPGGGVSRPSTGFSDIDGPFEVRSILDYESCRPDVSHQLTTFPEFDMSCLDVAVNSSNDLCN